MSGTTVPVGTAPLCHGGMAMPRGTVWPCHIAGRFCSVGSIFRLFACFDPFSSLFAVFAWFNLLPTRINKTSKNLKEYWIK